MNIVFGVFREGILLFAFFYFKVFFEVFVFFQEYGVVDDDLGSCDAQVQDAVIYGFGGLQGEWGLSRWFCFFFVIGSRFVFFRQFIWKVSRFFFRLASIDYIFSDLYTRFCTGFEVSKYSVRRAGNVVVFCRELVVSSREFRRVFGVVYFVFFFLGFRLVFIRSSRKVWSQFSWRSFSSLYSYYTFVRLFICLKFILVVFFRMIRVCGWAEVRVEILFVWRLVFQSVYVCMFMQMYLCFRVFRLRIRLYLCIYNMFK